MCRSSCWWRNVDECCNKAGVSWTAGYQTIVLFIALHLISLTVIHWLCSMSLLTRRNCCRMYFITSSHLAYSGCHYLVFNPKENCHEITQYRYLSLWLTVIIFKGNLSHWTCILICQRHFTEQEEPTILINSYVRKDSVYFVIY